MNITIVDGKNMKTDTLLVKCVEKSCNVKPFVTSTIVEDVKRKR